MRNLIIIILSLLLTKVGFSQSKPLAPEIKIIVYDSTTLKPISGCKISLYRNGVNKEVNYITDKLGTVVLNNYPISNDTLQISAVGYKLKSIGITKQNSEAFDKIYLIPNEVELKDVEIRGKRPLITQEIGKIIYDLRSDEDSKTQNLYEVMKKVPFISVGSDEKLLVKGGSQYKVFMDGRPSSLFLRNPSDIFKSMSASNIEKIEVITSPPAKYDGEGINGIINIITKKQLIDGYNGSISANYGRLISSSSGSFVLKNKKLGISGLIGTSWEKVPEAPFERELVNSDDMLTTFKQSGQEKFNNNTQYGIVQISYEIDSLNLITSSIGLNQSKSKRHNFLENSIFDQGLVTNIYQQTNAKLNNDNGNDFSINYQNGLSTGKKALLTGSYRYQDYENNQNLENISEQMANFPETKRMLNDFGSNEHTAQLDYSKPLRKISVDLGGKMIFRQNFSLDPQKDLTLTDFTYNQNIYSLYNSYQYKNGKFGARIGLRLERTNDEGDFEGTENKIIKRYTNLIPSVAIQYISGKSGSFNLGYTQRIQRPGIWQLNPFVDQFNTRFIMSGNPDLQPVLNNNIELGYNSFKKVSITTSLSYSFANNTIQNIVKIISDTLSLSSFENVGKNNNLNLSASIRSNLTTKLTLTLNGSMTRIWIKGFIDGDMLSNQGSQGMVSGYLNYQLPEGFRLSLNGGYYSPTIMLQGKSSDYMYSGIMVSKSILKKRGTLTTSITNPFEDSIKIKDSIYGKKINQYSYRRSNFRNYSISFRYSFGKTGTSIKRNKKTISNDDLKTGQSNP